MVIRQIDFEALEILGIDPLTLIDADSGVDKDDPLISSRGFTREKIQAEFNRLNTLHEAGLLDDKPIYEVATVDAEACEILGLDVRMLMDADFLEMLGLELEDSENDEEVVDDKQNPSVLHVSWDDTEDDGGYDYELEDLYNLNWSDVGAASAQHKTSKKRNKRRKAS